MREKTSRGAVDTERFVDKKEIRLAESQAKGQVVVFGQGCCAKDILCIRSADEFDDPPVKGGPDACRRHKPAEMLPDEQVLRMILRKLIAIGPVDEVGVVRIEREYRHLHHVEIRNQGVMDLERHRMDEVL